MVLGCSIFVHQLIFFDNALLYLDKIVTIHLVPNLKFLNAFSGDDLLVPG
jgi:hypothetical protein